MASLGKVPDWVALQTKVFTRWINQKFMSANRPERIENVLTGFGDGKIFGAFLEALSETKMTAKWNKGKMRVAHVDNINMSLEYAKKLGINVKNFPQATDFIDGQERPVLGFVWACILKFLKFGDDADESLSAKDALLMWVANRTAGYEGVKVESFPKSFKDGLALSALIHSGRPGCITYDGLQPGDQAIEAAFDGAEKYFEMEKFITVEEFKKFDEISMVVYVSDYYYGMARERKKDRAARRISQVVKFTKEMDEKKADFNKCAVSYRGRVVDVQKVLGDRSIDNTMAGAVQKLDDFTEYKKKDKGELIGDQLNLESQYNGIATRLSDKNRPAYTPPEGCRLSDVEKTMTELEAAEAERNVALHAELNRQRRLLKLDKQHKERSAQLNEWIAAKEAYLSTKEDVTSVGAAQYQLTVISSYKTESKDVQAGDVVELKKIGAELIAEKYEKSAEVQEREKFIDDKFVVLGDLATKKTAVLEDDLAREVYRADVRVKAAGHKDRYGKISAWIDKKEAYLNTKEEIDSSSKAALEVALIGQYHKERTAYHSSHVESLKKVGAEIRAAKYESALSSWVFETPEELDQREGDVDSRFANLDSLYSVKKPLLDDHLAREQHKDKLRIQDKSHSEMHADLVAWYNEKDAYLKDRPPIETVAEAQLQISTFNNYEGEKEMVTATSVASLKADGAAILADVYKTDLSEYSWEDPAGLKAREDDVDAKWASLESLAATLKADLDAALAREQEKERLRLLWTDLAGTFLRFNKSATNSANASIFGYSLEEVKAFEATMKAEDDATNATSASQKETYDKCWADMQAIGVKENAYCSETPETLAASSAELQAALSSRSDKYAAELARQVENDALCKEFADLVNSFSKWLSEEKDAVSKSNASNEDQLAKIEALAADKAKQAEKLDPIKSLEAKIDEKGIEQNTHTSLSAKDVEIQYDGFNVLLVRKTEMLKELIALSKLKGVTAEEWEEFNNNFAKFDKDGSGFLEQKEFKALMYSVGEELSKIQAGEIFNQYAGADGKIDRDGFLNYMVKLAGDNDSKENVVDGFKILSSNKDVTTRPELERLMLAEDVDFIYKTIPAGEGGEDYGAWCDEVFAR
jgi:hypothetical protein